MNLENNTLRTLFWLQHDLFKYDDFEKGMIESKKFELQLRVDLVLQTQFSVYRSVQKIQFLALKLYMTRKIRAFFIKNDRSAF